MTYYAPAGTFMGYFFGPVRVWENGDTPPNPPIGWRGFRIPGGGGVFFDFLIDKSDDLAGDNPLTFPAIPITLQRDLEAGFVLNLKPAMFDNPTHAKAIFDAVSFSDGRDLRFSLAPDGSRSAMHKVKFNANTEEVEIFVLISEDMLEGELIYLWGGLATDQPAPHQAFASKATWAGFSTAIPDMTAGTDGTGKRTLTRTGGTTKVINDLGAVGLGATKGTGAGNRLLIESFVEPIAWSMSFWINPATLGNFLMERGNGSFNLGSAGTRLRLTRRYQGARFAWWEVDKPTLNGLTCITINHSGEGDEDPEIYFNKTLMPILARQTVVNFPIEGGSDLTLNTRWDGSVGSDMDWGFFSLRDAPVSQEWVEALVDNQLDPTSVAVAGAIVLLADPGFTDEFWVDPGEGYEGDTDLLPGGPQILLQGGVGWPDYLASNNMWPRNLMHNRISGWQVNTVQDGNLNSEWLYENGYVDEGDRWIKNPNEGVLATKTIIHISTHVLASFDHTTPLPADDLDDYWDGRFIEITGGQGSVLPNAGGLNGLVKPINTANRMVVQLNANAGNWAIHISPAANFVAIDWTAFSVHEVEWNGSDYVQAYPTKFGSRLWRDNTSYYHCIRWMDILSQNTTSLRSLCDQARPGDLFHDTSPPRALLRFSHPIEQMLEDGEDQDRIPWIKLPFAIGCPVGRNLTKNAVAGGVRTVGGDLWCRDWEKNSYVLEANLGDGSLTLNANGTWDWSSVVPVTQNMLIHFTFSAKDFSGKQWTGLVYRCNVSWQGGTSSLVYDGLCYQSNVSGTNLQTITSDSFWRRSAAEVVDRFLASGRSFIKKTIFGVANEPWNTGGPFNITWAYCNFLGQALGLGNAMGAEGWLVARWAYFVRAEFFARGLPQPNILWSVCCQTADTNTQVSGFNGARKALLDLSVDPSKYIKPGLMEPTITSYSNGVWHPYGAAGVLTLNQWNTYVGNPSLYSVEIAAAWADTRAWWEAAITAGTAKAAYKAWLIDMVTVRSENAKWIVNQHLAHDAVAQSFGTRWSCEYEGGPHTQFPSQLQSSPTIVTLYYEVTWGEETADIYRVIHDELAAAFPGRQIMVSNFVINGYRAFSAPWNETPFWIQENNPTPRTLMWQEYGKQ